MSNDKFKKDFEIRNTKEYFKSIHNIILTNENFTDIDESIGDCYVTFNNEHYLLQVTSTFIQEEEKEYKITTKFLNNISIKDNVFERIYNNKNTLTTILINFNTAQALKEEIKNNINIIDSIACDNMVYYIDDKKYYTNTELINGISTSEDDFLKLIKYKDNKNNIIIIFKPNINNDIINIYTSISNYNEQKVRIMNLEFYWDNIEKQTENIINSIKKKINKYNQYIENANKNNIIFDKFILIVSPIIFKTDIDIDILKTRIKKDVKDINYDEIYINLCEPFLHIKKNE